MQTTYIPDHLINRIEFWRQRGRPSKVIQLVVENRVYESLTPEDQLWCQLAGVERVYGEDAKDAISGKIKDPTRRPGLNWTWGIVPGCWCTTTFWEKCPAPIAAQQRQDSGEPGNG